MPPDPMMFDAEVRRHVAVQLEHLDRTYKIPVGIPLWEALNKGRGEAVDACFQALVEQAKEFEAERQAIIACINLFGDTVLHHALDDAGLLMGDRQEICAGQVWKGGGGSRLRIVGHRRDGRVVAERISGDPEQRASERADGHTPDEGGSLISVEVEQLRAAYSPPHA